MSTPSPSEQGSCAAALQIKNKLVQDASSVARSLGYWLSHTLWLATRMLSRNRVRESGYPKSVKVNHKLSKSTTRLMPHGLAFCLGLADPSCTSTRRASADRAPAPSPSQCDRRSLGGEEERSEDPTHPPLLLSQRANVAQPCRPDSPGSRGLPPPEYSRRLPNKSRAPLWTSHGEQAAVGHRCRQKPPRRGHIR